MASRFTRPNTFIEKANPFLKIVCVLLVLAIVAMILGRVL